MKEIIKRIGWRKWFPILYVFALYAILPWGPNITQLARNGGVLWSITLCVLILCSGVLLYYLFKQTSSTAKALGVALLVWGAFALLWPLASTPEEKIHFVQYSVLPIIADWSWTKKRVEQGWSETRSVVQITFFSILVGMGDEGIQALLPNRYFEWKDMGINVTSSLIWSIALLISKKRTIVR